MLLQKVYEPESLERWRAALQEYITTQSADPAVKAAGKTLGLSPEQLKELLTAKFRARQSLPKIMHVVVETAPKSQKIPPRYLRQLERDGVVSTVGGVITFKTAPGELDLQYKIVSVPGTYCNYCGAELGEDKESRQLHALEHDPAEHPDPDNPVPYEVQNYYTCERVD